MPYRVKTITLSLPCRLGSVNYYLIETDARFVLIDNGTVHKESPVKQS